MRALRINATGYMALATSDNHLKVYSLATASLIRELQIPGLPSGTGIVNDIDISDNSRYLVTAGEDQLVRVWELATGYS